MSKSKGYGVRAAKGGKAKPTKVSGGKRTQGQARTAAKIKNRTK